MYQYRKTITSPAGTVTFTPVAVSGTRYTGLLFITQNNSTCSIYAVGCKVDTDTAYATKLSGKDVNITITPSTGAISFDMPTWSQATLMVDNEFT